MTEGSAMRISLSGKLGVVLLGSLLVVGCAGLGSKVRSLTPSFGRQGLEKNGSRAVTSKVSDSTGSQPDLALPVRKSFRADQ